MSVNPTLLATEITTGIGQVSPTIQVQGFATGILGELTANGIAQVGLPTGNTISGLSASDMASKIANAAGYASVSSDLTKMCVGIVNHIQSVGVVSYVGPIPPAVPIYYLGGTISGLSGSGMASLVQSNVGYPSISTELLGMCNAICTHITTNAQVTSGVIS